MNTHTSQIEQQPSSLVAEPESITIFHYESQAVSLKNQITLRQNLFSFLLEGEKTVYYAGASVQIKPGQFLLLSAGNCLMSEKTAGEAGLYKSILISFDNKLLSDFFMRHSATFRRPIDNVTEEPFLLFEQDGFLTNYLESIRQLLHADGSLAPDMRTVKLEELLLYLNQTHPGHLQTLHRKSQEANDELLIRQAVTANLDRPVTIEELAFLCHVSLSTFKRRFAHLYGNSPTKWFLEKRMQKAARLLKQDKLKACEIYDELGYENLSSFIQSFKQVYGLTPKQYQVANLPGTRRTLSRFPYSIMPINTMNRDYFLDLANYNHWVSGTIIGWLNQLDDRQWNQVVTSSFSSVRQTTLHLISAEMIWLDYWQQVPDLTFLSTHFEGTKEDLIQIWIRTSAALQAFIQAYPEANYQQPVRFTWRNELWQMSFWQTFAHFINHATYHRGQLVTLLRQVGFTKLSSTDLATYFRTHESIV